MKNIEHLRTTPSLAKSLFEHGDTQATVRAFCTRIIDYALNKYLEKDEVDMVINGYRRSEWNETALDADLKKLDCDEHFVTKDEHYQAAIAEINRRLKPERKLQPVHVADLRHYKWRLSTSIGAPYATSEKWKRYVKDKYNYAKHNMEFKNIANRDLFVEAHRNSAPLTIKDTRMTKHNLYTEMFFINRKAIHRIKDGHLTNEKGHDYKYWNTAFARRHLVAQSEPDKIRLVFGAPSLLLTAELMFIWPLQVYIMNLKGPDAFMLWGYETLLGGWYRLRNFFSQDRAVINTFATIDWSGFDRSARHTVIKDIHDLIMRPLFNFEDGYHPTIHYRHHPQNPTQKTYDERLTNVWNWMTDTIRNIPLMTPDGRQLRFRHSGIFSGYFQTQILDSLYNLVMIFTILSRMGYDLSSLRIKVQGDDSIFALPTAFDSIKDSFLNEFETYAAYYFGATLNVKKSEISDTLQHMEVLKYRNRNGLPYRDTCQLLAQLRHPERSWAPEDVAARCIGIALASCGCDPRVYMICKDIFTYLVDKKNITPRRAELQKMFRHIDETNTFDTLNISVDRFPEFHELYQHMIDDERDLAKEHWPLDFFINFPGTIEH